MDKIKQFFKMRWVGFYLLLPVVVLSLVVPIVYMVGFLKTAYMSAWVVVLSFVAIATITLAFFKPTARYAPIAMFAMELAGLLVFVKTSYMHLTTAFFGGINGNVLEQAGFPFSFCAIAYVLNIVICIVAMFFGQYRGEKQFGGNVAEKTVVLDESSTEVGK